VWHFEESQLKSSYLPSPAHENPVWTLADSPRIVPPNWGATPIPEETMLIPELTATSGWDLENNAPDIYVFFLEPNGYAKWRKEFLLLTGNIPVPPLYAFGLIDSRYHPYTQQQALQTIDAYRSRKIPLDMFVVDTDWREGASHGYAVNKTLFPDLEAFIRAAHQRQVRLMLNDHPEPIDDALSPAEMQFRWQGLTSLLSKGIDVWWYDRNWSTRLREPVKGIAAEIWGQRLYYDMTSRFRPQHRPLIMSNVQGIDNGTQNYPSHASSHRFPIWWTGDTQSTFAALRAGVENGVNSGILGLMPYVHEDLGGHVGNPSSELYVRFLQFGALSPIMRLHCTKGRVRFPWAFGEKAEKIAKQWIETRYRMLPLLYAAAFEAHLEGTPLMRRLDLYWPQHSRAAQPTQFLLGKHLLVAPIFESQEGPFHLVPGDLLRSGTNQQGLKAEYYDNPNLTGLPVSINRESNLSHEWGGYSPDRLPKDGFSARWTTRLGPIPRSGTYRLSLLADDGVRLFIDGKKLIDAWVPQDSVTQKCDVPFEQGKTYELKIEYFEKSGGARVLLGWQPPGVRRAYAQREVWLPPGEWMNPWTGGREQGPKVLTVSSPLWHVPLWVQAGAIIPSIDVAQSTGQSNWKDLHLDVCVPSKSGSSEWTMFEDDGISNRYLMGDFYRTKVTLHRSNRDVTLRIGQPTGKSFQSPKSWRVKLSLPRSTKIVAASMGGRKLAVKKRTSRLSFLPSNEDWGKASAPAYEMYIPAESTAHEIKLKLSR